MPSGEKKIVKGKILRSGYVPHTAAFQRYGQQYAYAQSIYSNPQGGGQPIVEVEGKIQFGLPGKPIFDALDRRVLEAYALWRLWSATRRVESNQLPHRRHALENYNAVAPGRATRSTSSRCAENMSESFENAARQVDGGRCCSHHR
jgi:hypothetical protein